MSADRPVWWDRQRILDAGGLYAADLSENARRVVATLSRSDEATIDGVVELLQAARRAGKRDTEKSPMSDSPAAALRAALARLDVRSRRVDPPELGL